MSMNRRAGRRPGRGASSGIVWTPRAITGLKLWLRADLGVTIGTGVSAWADQSGNGNNVTQGTGSKQPTFNATDAAFNNKTTLSFAAASAQCLQGTFGVSVAVPYTLFIVGSVDRAYARSWFDGSTVGGRAEAYTDGVSDKMYAGTAFISAADVSTSPRVMTYEMNGASSNIYISSNTSAVTGDPGSNTLAGATIGAAFDQLSDALNGKLAEVVLYGALLNATQQAQVRAYLGSRYGVTIT